MAPPSLTVPTAGPGSCRQPAWVCGCVMGHSRGTVLDRCSLRDAGPGAPGHPLCSPLLPLPHAAFWLLPRTAHTVKGPPLSGSPRRSPAQRRATWEPALKSFAFAKPSETGIFPFLMESGVLPMKRVPENPLQVRCLHFLLRWLWLSMATSSHGACSPWAGSP